MQSRRTAGSAGILPADPAAPANFPGNLARTVRGVQAGCLRSQPWLASKRVLVATAITICIAVVGWAIAFKPTWISSLSPSSPAAINAANLDQRLQRAATLALGDRRGTVIVMDPQTGRIRAVVNPEVAFGENFPPGSALKPFTALAALRSGLIDEDSRNLCHERYSHDAFQTTCSHPRDLRPLNPVEAIAYSCNYYFSTLGERLTEPNFTTTLDQFGFGRKTGVAAKDESPGQLQRNNWRPQNAIGEGNYLQVTPVQLIDAYTALVNGGRLFTPRRAEATGFAADVRAQLEISDGDRDLIVKGMRGAVRYGSAEKANLYSLPVYIFGKTGTATELNGFRTHGWFVGFTSRMADNQTTAPEAGPQDINLAVLVFLTKGHGFEAAEVSRSVFAEYGRVADTEGHRDAETRGRAEQSAASGESPSPRLPVTASQSPSVHVHLVHENITRTMPLEDYVRGVVAAEGSMEREPEALKALAIASRTFVLKNLGRHAREGYDFCTSTHCQRYRDVSSDSAADVAPAINEAVAATRGEILRDGSNELADSYFSASCGGATANVATLWGGNAPAYLRGVRDESCASEAHHSWTDVISQTQLLTALQSDPRTDVGGRLVSVSVLRTDQSGRAELISIEGNRRITVKGWDFKIIVGRALGWNLLKSSRFEIVRSGSNFIFRGSGFGHGLGLCQEGAHVMAARGASYRQILAKYFPSTHIARQFNFPTSADLMWRPNPKQKPDRKGGLSEWQYPMSQTEPTLDAGLWSLDTSEALPNGRGSAWRSTRHTLSSENFRISYPSVVSQREVEGLLNLLQLSRRSLIARAAAAGVNARFPPLEIFVNETTGDFVGRTGQPPWAAAATRGNKIELQPIATLKRRRILETTLRHELVHTLVEIIGHGRTPRWLAEGLALHLAGEGRMVTRYRSLKPLTTADIERQLGGDGPAKSENEMKAAYAGAYIEVRRLIDRDGEASIWRRMAQ